VQRVLDAHFLLLHLRLGGRADLDHRDAAHQLRQPLLQLLAVVVAGRLLDLLADLVDATLDVRPSGQLLVAVLAIVAIAAVLPYTALGALLRFTPLPGSLLAAIACLAITYLLVVQAVKTWFYRRHALL
jgi:hypothetical protein